MKQKREGDGVGWNDGSSAHKVTQATRRPYPTQTKSLRKRRSPQYQGVRWLVAWWRESCLAQKKEMTFRSGWTHGVKEFIKGWLASEHARSQSSWEHLVYNWRKNIQRSSIQNDKRVKKKWQHFAWKYVTLDTLMKFENSSPTGLEKGLMNKGGHCGY